VQKIVYGNRLVSPKDFWDLQPKDIIMAIEGFNEQRQYDERLQVETLRVIRHIGHTAYLLTPMKKSAKRISLENYYPLPFDKVKEELSKEDKIEIFNRYGSVITNGKLRGFRDVEDNLWNKDKTKIIGHITRDGIQYIN
jgi:hypothetical protein